MHSGKQELRAEPGILDAHLMTSGTTTYCGINRAYATVFRRYAYADWKVANYAQPICGQKNRPSDVFTGWATKDVPPLCFECSVQYALQDCMLEPEETNAWWLFWKMRREGREDPLKI